MYRYQLLVLGSFGLILILFAVLPFTVPASDAPAKASEEVEELVRRLGSKSFETREAASRQLLAREDAIPALERARKADDAEIARRAKEILDEIGQREEKRALAKLADFAKIGEIDRVVELLIRRKKWDAEDSSLQVMTDLSKTLMEKGQKTFGKSAVPTPNDRFPMGDFKQYVKKVDPTILFSNEIGCEPRKKEDRNYVVRGDDIVVRNQVSDSLLVSGGSIRGGPISESAVFANGSIDCSFIFNSIIVCGGDFKVRGCLKNCLLIAHGNVTFLVPASGTSSCIVSSGSVRVPMDIQDKTIKVKDKEGVPLGFVKFFDPSRVGVTVEAADGGVKVTKAEESKSFGRAGLKVNDVIITLDGKEVNAPEPFRRLLRTKLAEGGKMLLKVRRDGGTVEIPVTCLD